MKNMEVGKTSEAMPRTNIQKSTFFQNDLCCSANLKLNITELSSEPTLLCQVAPQVVFFLLGTEDFLISTFPDSIKNARSSPSHFLLNVFYNSHYFQVAQIAYTVWSIQHIIKTNKYLLITYHKQLTCVDTILPSLALYSDYFTYTSNSLHLRNYQPCLFLL